MAARISIKREFLFQKMKPRIHIYFTIARFFICAGTNYATEYSGFNDLFSLFFRISDDGLHLGTELKNKSLRDVNYWKVQSHQKFQNINKVKTVNIQKFIESHYVHKSHHLFLIGLNQTQYSPKHNNDDNKKDPY